jgi:integrase
MRIFNRLLIAAGIERLDANGRKLDIHALRHTMASRLARNGVGLVQAQRLLGHSDPKLTAAVYSHLDVDDLRRAIERVPESVLPLARPG